MVDTSCCGSLSSTTTFLTPPTLMKYIQGNIQVNFPFKIIDNDGGGKFPYQFHQPYYMVTSSPFGGKHHGCLDLCLEKEDCVEGYLKNPYQSELVCLITHLLCFGYPQPILQLIYINPGPPPPQPPFCSFLVTPDICSIYGRSHRTSYKRKPMISYD